MGRKRNLPSRVAGMKVGQRRFTAGKIHGGVEGSLCTGCARVRAQRDRSLMRSERRRLQAPACSLRV